MQGAGVYDAVSVIFGAIASIATGPLGNVHIEQSSFDEQVRSRPYGLEANFSSDDPSLSGFVSSRAALPVDVSKLPDTFINAVIAAEDRRFTDHRGVDPVGLAAAVADTIGGRTRGGSTITQQMIKNTVSGADQTLNRKIEEAILSLRAGEALERGEILQIYLENAWFGRTTNGVADAPMVWFGKSWDEISLAESVLLASLLKGAQAMDPLDNPEVSVDRRDAILGTMLDEGWISREDHDAARSEEIEFNEEDFLQSSGWVASSVSSEIARLVEGRRIQGGNFDMNISTTVDADWQLFAQDALRAEISKRGMNEDGTPVLQGSVVVLDPRSGEILATVGGYDYDQSAFDRTRAMRQPGSSVKPFLYIAAMEAGYDPNDWVSNSVRTYSSDGVPWRPQNYDGTSSGDIRMFEAVEQSSNLSAAWIADRIGISSMAFLAEAAGAYPEGGLKRILPSSLGASETTITRMTASYGSILNDGIAVQPHIIRSLTDASGMQDAVFENGQKVVPEQNGLNYPIASARSLDSIASMMRGVVVRGTASQSFKNNRVMIVGKTGTSQNNRDAWFIGATPHVAIGVWIGKDNANGMGDGVTGGLTAAPVAASILENALETGLINENGYRDDNLTSGTTWPPTLFDLGSGSGFTSAMSTETQDYFGYEPAARVQSGDDYFIEGDGTIVFGQTAGAPAPSPSPETRQPAQNAPSYFDAQPAPGAAFSNREDPYFQ